MIHGFYFILGTTLGSFSCCLGYRLGRGQSPWSPKRSYCDSCQHPLASWQLLPIVGWLLQGGHCHYCNQWISPFLPVTEMISGIATTFLCPGSPWLVQIIFFVACSTLATIVSCDYFHLFIYPLFLLGLTPLFFIYHPSWGPGDTVLAVSFLLLLLISTLRFHSLGSGDIELIAVDFITVGCYPTFLIILFACLLTLLLYPLSQKRVPFIPGLALATTTTLVYLSTF